MSNPDELADVLFAKRADAMDWRSYAYVSKAELRTLARAAAKAAWEEGYAGGFEDGAPDPEMYAITINPYSMESYE